MMSEEEASMPETSLLTICGSALVAVFVLLLLLAAVIRLITLVFPSRETTVDASVIAGISAAVAAIYPGARVTRIEEVK